MADFPTLPLYPSIYIFPTPATFHSDTLDWRDRAVAAGGLVEDIDLLALDPFVEGV